MPTTWTRLAAVRRDCPCTAGEDIGAACPLCRGAGEIDIEAEAYDWFGGCWQQLRGVRSDGSIVALTDDEIRWVQSDDDARLASCAAQDAADRKAA